MRLLDVLSECGRNGVISRLVWMPEDPRLNAATPVILVRKFDRSTGRSVLVEISDTQIGNWEPAADDLTANDWFVLAKSQHPHT